MKSLKINIFKKIQLSILVVALCLNTVIIVNAQIPDPNQGLRADWMRGAWGVNWKPERFENNQIVGVSIQPYLDQLSGLKTIDFVQVHLSESNIYSACHSAPHALLESLWQGDLDASGKPVNLVVPSAASGADPFKDWLLAIKAAGLKTMVYVNSYNLLARNQDSAPSAYPDFSTRWMHYCDTSATVQAFIKSKSYHTGTAARRPYMFCYAEYVLKEYAIRYGDLIDAWGFDSGDNIMADECGDDPKSDDINDLRIYEAFANACHAGNPNAAIAFNNSVGTYTAPFSTATYFDDFTFGHPFGGAGNMVETESLYSRNFGVCEFMRDHSGYPFAGDVDGRAWNDKVVSRFFPKLSTTSWNAGATPCLTDSQFVAWNSVGVINAGSILWGAPLIRNNLMNSPILTLQPKALVQLELADAYLQKFQNPGKPNWARQTTVLPDAFIGQVYYRELVNGVDFWDTDDDASVVLIKDTSLPSWITITASATTPGNFILSGKPNVSEPTNYSFSIRVADATEGVTRVVDLQVNANTHEFTNPGNGFPVWYADTIVIPNVDVSKVCSQVFVLGKDFNDFDEGDVLTISKKGEANWLSISELTSGVWELKGIPSASDEGVYIDTLILSDGTHSVERMVKIKVNQPIFDLSADYHTVQIQATDNTDYGVDQVATMVSDVITAPDGLATFQVSIDVTPGRGKSILSGISGGSATTKSWGLGGDGRDATKKYLFYGLLADWVSFGNIQVLNFKANGGALSLSDFAELAIDSITLVNALSGGKDAVSYAVNGDTTKLGNLSISPETINVPNVKQFKLGVGNSNDMNANKWAVEGIRVAYSLGSFYSVNITSENGDVSNSQVQPAYQSGTQIKLIARPDLGYLFDGWSGDTIGATIQGDTLIVEMDEDKNLIASFSPVTGIPKIKNEFSYTISPNPSNAIFRVNLDQITKGIYSVYSMNGKKIAHGFANGSFEFDLSNFEKGVYLFKLKSEMGVDVKKILLN